MSGTTTTHDPQGGGRPRLIFAAGGRKATREPEREFTLLPGITTIGSSTSCDLCLEGIDLAHARIDRDDSDNYIYVDLGTTTGSRVRGAPVGTAMLSTGARIELGPWTLIYFREEFADHGRPHGGRSGGELAYQRPQDEPAARGTSSDGGRAATETDAGEYF